MTIITGISGFLAGNLAVTLQQRGETVLGVGRRAPFGMASDIPYRSLDLADFEAVCQTIQDIKPTSVYHLAAVSVLTAADGPGGARAVLETNVGGTWNLLEACRLAEVESVVVASSDKQYGALANPPYDDEDTTAFLNGGLYELSKAQQDQVARLYAGLYSTPAIRVARLCNLYGPGDRAWSRVIPGTIRRSLEKIPPRITQGRAGAALREYIFVDDAITALCALNTHALAQGNSPFQRTDGKLARVAYNIGSPHRHSARTVIESVQTVLRDDFGIVAPPPEEQPGLPNVFEPGDQLSRQDRLRALCPEYAPRTLIDGLRATIPWYLEALADG